MRTVNATARVGVLLFFFCLLEAAGVWAQGTLADYERSRGLREARQKLAYDVPERANWIGTSHRFWYRKTVRGGHEFVLVNADTSARQPAFDHEKVAASLAAAANEKYTALTLPFDHISYSDDDAAIEFDVDDSRWRCDLSSYDCKKVGAAQGSGRGGRGRRGGPPSGSGPGEERQPLVSPDGKSEAFIRNYNLFVRVKATGTEAQFSFDGSEGDFYTWSMQWSPDSTKLAVFRTKPGYRRQIHLIESSPTDQLQPRLSSITYAKPGDVLDVHTPVLFHVDGRKQIEIDNRLFPLAYASLRIGENVQSRVDPPRWWKDSRAFTFEYNQRGHQVYRIIEVDGTTGQARALVNEEVPTFFCYSGKKFRHDVGDGREIIWMSERDGWNHLYLYDGTTGRVKNQITRGNWVVRAVDKVDEEKRQIWFQALGMNPGQDPYFVHYYRISFDGTGLVAFTEADGNHSVSFSEDRAYYVDTWSRVDQPPVSELRRTSDRSLVSVLERADIRDLVEAGWRAPEVFVSKGRDGTTDIWGVIFRPGNLDPSRKYPVIENIYAGPQGSFVPKSFASYNAMQSLAELGFVVVQIDGMGTSNRSKAFHDVAWRNLGDAGFPDRILWHKAVAAKYPYYDISRVGIYGTSAGGQSSMGALLFHPEFYKVAVSNSGCHDNRMDKLWWNEQWMGYPLGPHYAASSNGENAHKLQGRLLLVLPEMDINVDPSSTLQVVNALIRAGKFFDLLYVPGAGHGARGEYTLRKRDDFFVQHLLGVTPPDWNITDLATTTDQQDNPGEGPDAMPGEEP